MLLLIHYSTILPKPLRTLLPCFKRTLSRALPLPEERPLQEPLDLVELLHAQPVVPRASHGGSRGCHYLHRLLDLPLPEPGLKASVDHLRPAWQQSIRQLLRFPGYGGPLPIEQVSAQYPQRQLIGEKKIKLHSSRRGRAGRVELYRFILTQAASYKAAS